MSFKLWHAPLRLSTGAFILNSGFNHKGADDELAKGLHGMATTAIPQFGKMQPKAFAQLMSVSELALGTALLVPKVPTSVAGAGLATFSAGLIQFYMKAPGMRNEGSVRPTQQGAGVAKDIWMFAIGVALMLDAAGSGAKRTTKKLRR